MFAVAARMVPDKLTFTITTNANVKVKTIKHIQRIWEHLDTLGDEYARMQKCPLTRNGDDDNDADEEEDQEDESDDAPPPKLSELFEAQRLLAEDFKRYMYERFAKATTASTWRIVREHWA